MRLMISGAAALMLAAGMAGAFPAGADPTTTDPSVPATPAPSAMEAPEPSATASAEPTSPAPTTSTAAPTSSSPAALPAGAHQVTYTITTTSDLTANIYYVTADPPNQAKANDPQFMPMARTGVGPGAPWTFQTTLNNPTQWAFVSASGGLRVNPEFHCELAVDGQVVASQQGGSGVQCALRPW